MLLNSRNDQHILDDMLDVINSNNQIEQEANHTNTKIVSKINISALTVEKINRNLFKASEFHDENNRKSWHEASRYYAGR